MIRGLSLMIAAVAVCAALVGPASPAHGRIDQFITTIYFYATTFTATENPISESGRWIAGQAAGNNLWGDIRTDGTKAYGVTEPTQFGDPTAVLVGSWPATQSAEATVTLVSGNPSSGTAEVEVRLRTTINSVAHTINGYEVYCSIVSTSSYCHIAGWGGANGTWKNLDECAGVSYSTFLTNGQVIKGTASGSNPTTVTLYIDGVQRMQIVDDGNIGGSCLYNGDNAAHGPYTTGTPGIGFYNDGGSPPGSGTNFDRFGFTRFVASGQ